MPSGPVALYAIVASVLLFVARPAAAQPAPLEGLDAYIERTMLDWEVPGLAIAVVREDSVIFARGYGVREVGGADPVDEHTLFAVASTTKAMTAAALGMLVDEGRLGWDDAAVDHLPSLRLADAWIERELTIRDLLTHRSGLSRSDLVWIAGPFDRQEVLRRARHLTRDGGFRAQYGYHNIMYIAAGEVVGAVAGGSWDDFLARRLFAPLRMQRTTTRAADVERQNNVATSHSRVDGRVVAVERRNYDNLGGAGSAFSSASDMAQWLRLLLGGGVYDGERLLAEGTVAELFTPQTVIRTDTVARRLFPATNLRAYGLGWGLQDYHGRLMVHHSGNVNWTRTQLGMIPAENVGVVVIANLSSSTLQAALMYRVLDAFLGLEPTDWSAEYLALARRAEERAAEREGEVAAARITGTRPSLELGAYAGAYSNALAGAMRVALESDRLVLRYSPDYVADLEHWHHDTFRAVWRRPGFGHEFLTFNLDARGRPAGFGFGGFGDFRRESGSEAASR